MATQFQNFKKKLTRDFIKNNQTPNWDEYPKIKDHWKSFVEYKKSETFSQKSAQAKNSASKKGEYNHRLGRGGYAVAIPKWRKRTRPLLMDKRHIHLRSASVQTYTFFTTGFPRFLSIRGARGLQAFDQFLLTNYSNPNYD
jgi:hypothetical protein